MSTAPPAAPPNAAYTESPEGSARLIVEARAFVDRAIDLEPSSLVIPTIATRKEPFPPVLVERMLLASAPEVHARLLARSQRLKVSQVLSNVLEQMRAGGIANPTALKSALIAQLVRPFRIELQQSYFDLLYGALQLMILSKGTDTAQTYAELFQLCVGHIYSLVSIRPDALPYQVEHFLAHAAVYISLNDSNDLWRNVVADAGILMEAWGMAPPPEGVFVHCALNLGLKARNLPMSDLPYDLVKHLRRRVSQHEMTDREAFEVLTLTFGYRLSSSLMRVLWNNALEDYSRHEREIASRAFEIDPEAGWNTAQKRRFCSDLGIPYVKTDRALTELNMFALSFPGGWTIGGTSIVCKAGRFRILLDCGAAAMGAAGGNDPELDLADCLLVTHAHQDHIGGLLELYREGRFNGPWYATRQTGILGRLTLLDSVRLHKEVYGLHAIYDEVMLEKIMDKFIPVEYGTEFDLDPSVHVKAFPAGHVPGACQWQITHGEKRFVFSGDINLRTNLSDATRGIEFPSEEELSSTIGVAVEGTYAFSEERLLENSEAREDLIREIQNAPSKPVLVPVLSLGRAQEVCAALSGTEFRVGVFGLASRMTRAVSRLLKDNIVLEDRRPESIKNDEYDVLVASSGCLQGGPSKVFYERSDLKGIPVILTGHIFPGTPAKALLNKVPRVRFSAHAPSTDWQSYVSHFGNARKFVIHLPGWPSRLQQENTIVPRRHLEYLVSAPGEAATIERRSEKNAIGPSVK
jgi:Cft2 family RNA processing exonuclease